MQKWEYLTRFLDAVAEREVDYLMETRSWKEGIPRNTPEALVPQLNALGEQGWEMMSIEPVIAGKNADILCHADQQNRWTFTYFCVFKRPLG